MSTPCSRALLVCAVALSLVPASRTRAAEEPFPFVIPGDDASPSATDMSFLSPRPAGADGFVRVQDGHFATEAGRVRFWGVNLTFGADFPAHADAEKVAAHLAKLGINAVRIHHHDTARAPRGIWGPFVDGHRSLDAGQLDRQDYFLNELHRHGIYANLNLHVGRELTPEEGVSRTGLPYATRYDKYLLYFMPGMRRQLKEFCRAYLLHENPYRHLRRVDDPGIAMIEITNENAFSNVGPRLAAELPEPFRGEFKRQWNDWIARRYHDTATLRQAWAAAGEPLGQPVADSRTWSTGAGPWRVRQSREFPLGLTFGEPGPEPAIPAVRLEPRGGSGEVSAQEIQNPGLHLQPGRYYTLSFWLRSDAPRTLFADVSRQGPDWNSVGFRETLTAGPKWQHIKRVFQVSDNLAGPARICLKLGGSSVPVWLAGVSLQRGADWTVLPEGQTVEARNIEIPVSGWTPAADRDVRRFMVDVEREFFVDLVGFLKKDLGVRVPITGSQLTYNPPEVIAATCDYADIHAYWQHPRFPRKPWDPSDWNILNTPMEAAPDSNVLLDRATWRLLGMPYTLSEWNIPAPSDYAAGVAPFAALVASLQDWDGIFFFDYSSTGDDLYPDKIQRYFAFNGDPVKLAMLAACADVFRRGDIAPLSQVLAGTPRARLPQAAAFQARIGIDPKATAPASVDLGNPKRLITRDGRALWDGSDADHAHVAVNTPATRAVWGLVGGQSYELGDVRVAFGPTGRNYAALVLASSDGQPLDRTGRALLTVVGSAENVGMQWNESRTSIGNHWGTGPTQVNGIPVEITLPGRGIRVWALDGRGQHVREVPVSEAGGVAHFRVGPADRTLWYELERAR